MAILLIILGSLVLVIVCILLYGRYSMMPKYFYKPSPLLKQLFVALNDRLPAAAKDIIPQQLDYFKWGSPLPFPKYLSVDIRFDTKDPRLEKYSFDRKDVYKLATISFECAAKQYSADFKCAQGYISDIVIRPRTRGILRKKNITITKFKLHNDPMEQLDLEIVNEFYPAGEAFPVILAELNVKYAIQEAKKPLPVEKRKLFLRINQVKFPKDYLALLEQTNGFSIHNVFVNGIWQYDEVPMNDGTYLTLADGPGGVLALKQSKRNSRLKYISVEDENDIRDLGDQFLPALEKFITIVKDN